MTNTTAAIVDEPDDLVPIDPNAPHPIESNVGEQQTPDHFSRTTTKLWHPGWGQWIVVNLDDVNAWIAKGCSPHVPPAAPVVSDPENTPPVPENTPLVPDPATDSVSAAPPATALEEVIATDKPTRSPRTR